MGGRLPSPRQVGGRLFRLIGNPSANLPTPGFFVSSARRIPSPPFSISGCHGRFSETRTTHACDVSFFVFGGPHWLGATFRNVTRPYYRFYAFARKPIQDPTRTFTRWSRGAERWPELGHTTSVVTESTSFDPHRKPDAARHPRDRNLVGYPGEIYLARRNERPDPVISAVYLMGYTLDPQRCFPFFRR